MIYNLLTLYNGCLIRKWYTIFAFPKKTKKKFSNSAAEVVVDLMIFAHHCFLSCLTAQHPSAHMGSRGTQIAVDVCLCLEQSTVERKCKVITGACTEIRLGCGERKH